MGTVAQSSSNMQGLLVLASLAVATAQVLPLGYHGLGLGYAGIVHPYAAHVVKPVVRRWRSQWRPSNSRWPRLAARTPSVTLCLAPGRGDRLKTLLRLVLRPLLLRLLLPLLLFCLWDFPSDTLVLDTLPSPML